MNASHSSDKQAQLNAEELDESSVVYGEPISDDNEAVDGCKLTSSSQDEISSRGIEQHRQQSSTSMASTPLKARIASGSNQRSPITTSPPMAQQVIGISVVDGDRSQPLPERATYSPTYYQSQQAADQRRSNSSIGYISPASDRSNGNGGLTYNSQHHHSAAQLPDHHHLGHLQQPQHQSGQHKSGGISFIRNRRGSYRECQQQGDGSASSMDEYQYASSPNFEHINESALEDIRNDPDPKDYSLPAKKSDFYSFLDNPGRVLSEKLCRITDIGKRTAHPSRLREYNSSNFYQAEANASVKPDELSPIPPPALPNIECSTRIQRLQPLTENEFETKYIFMSRKEILHRVFISGIEGNALKRRLWPYILGLVELDADESAWAEYERLYMLYKSQWSSITPDQEERFSDFRDRKNVLQRDAVRCDRTHPFYRKEENIEKVKEIMMNYVMHDFDTGYIQGMTDLLAPILYIFDGDVVKSFWCFVQVLNFSKKNFSMKKDTVFYQLKLLFKLIDLTDPYFAKHLAENESSNCNFAFRWLLCLFKREFVKERTEDYTGCLITWEAIWCIHALQMLREDEEKAEQQQLANKQQVDSDRQPRQDEQPSSAKGDQSSNGYASSCSPSAARQRIEEDLEVVSSSLDVTCNRSCNNSKNLINTRIDDVHLFCLCICLAMVRRERDLILQQACEACDIIEHFNNTDFDSDFSNILSHATTIWQWLREDGKEHDLYSDQIDINADEVQCKQDDFDFLSNEYKPAVNGFNVY